ncbi:MAG: TetR/AcrR family transcriptional regulator [Thermoguttaceae bacterium]|jgi:AcrR family transcriptional regulator
MAEAKLDTRRRREQIAAAALELVASQGVRRLSVAAVARRVGLVPSGIYRHFRSKDAMLDAVLDLLEQKMLAFVSAARQEAADSLARLQSLLMHHIRFIREGRAFPRIVFSDEVFIGHPQRKTQVRRIVTAYLGQVEQLVREGQQQGTIRKDLLPRTVAVMFLGMIVPAGVLWHLTEGGFNVTQHAGRAWRMFRTAIASRR